MWEKEVSIQLQMLEESHYSLPVPKAAIIQPDFHIPNVCLSLTLSQSGDTSAELSSRFKSDFPNFARGFQLLKRSSQALLSPLDLMTPGISGFWFIIRVKPPVTNGLFHRTVPSLGTARYHPEPCSSQTFNLNGWLKLVSGFISLIVGPLDSRMSDTFPASDF